VITWMIKPKRDIRAKARHPWVFNSEIQSQIKNVQPGSLVKLTDNKGQFICSGYGNPKSQICFRGLSWGKDEITPDWIQNKIVQAFLHRKRLGISASFRAVYSEADSLSGLIVDCYQLRQNGRESYCLSVQVLTAGMKNLGLESAQFWKAVIEKLSLQFEAKTWDVVIRKDSPFRKQEGLAIEPTVVIIKNSEFDLQNASAVHPILTQITVQTDLVTGQKTGFFLDQAANIKNLLGILKAKTWPQKSLRLLDVCSHTGQWSLCVSVFMKSLGIEVQPTLIDISEQALQMAGASLQEHGIKSTLITMDALDTWDQIENQKFDIVIVDPPAFAKGKTDTPQAIHAYMKINAAAMERTQFQGILVSCSCSGVITEQDLIGALGKASRRSNRSLKIISVTGHGLDHPLIPEFPEGKYLKCITSEVQ
jgi:23S rRNA (cytosine1962-C5)-methyltransferase